MHGELELASAPARPRAGIGSHVLAEMQRWMPVTGAITAAEWREQRARQVELVLWHLTIRASFGTLWEQHLDDTVQVAVNMLRAGPDASPLTQLQGRYV